MNLRVKAMEEHDIGACTAIFIAAFSSEPWNDTSGPDDVSAYLLRFLELEGSMCFVCLSDDAPAAMSIGMKKPYLGGVEYYIDQFCVAPAHQRRGIGSFFLNRIEALCAGQGVSGMLLNTEFSFPARLFYERNGFHVVEGLSVLVKE